MDGLAVLKMRLIRPQNSRLLKLRSLSSDANPNEPPKFFSFIANIKKYFKNLKWVPIPLSVGFGYICYQQYSHIRKRELKQAYNEVDPQESLLKDWQGRKLWN
ncbi:uncharacterized protein LOC117116189 [Anneissia japonica]|uniref:uncharacterized protein LOC117116189 n=1 Tax=Anneissia japonica TaxID=1529436 RepID=UPI00142565FC|nr:uncharacterized protein LOC117116189 [Anneissia japonica]